MIDKIKLSNDLKAVEFKDFDINTMPASCLIKSRHYNFAISKWVSPKRTRSYPFERVYNTLSISKKITVIPVVKDEGAKGDRDFLQWDTVSLMSLLDVYVIFAYYNKAEKHKTRKDKITNQKFDNAYVISKIDEIGNYHSSALHWNLKEIKDTLPNMIEGVKKCYFEIGNQLDVKFHSPNGIDKFQKQFENGVKIFMKTSREKAKQAQYREQSTLQPKEILQTATKSTITIKNYLGGLYYLTTDEIQIKGDNLYLIEGKHSKNAKLPSISDIKDGLVKMILYTNLINISINNKNFTAIPTLKLTSSKLTDKFDASFSETQKNNFFHANQLNSKQIKLINNLVSESRANGFELIIQGL